MGKRQTRRSISVKGITYQRLKTFCEDPDTEGGKRPVSGWLEDVIAEKMDAAGVPMPRLPVRSYPLPEQVTAAEIEAQPPANFTF